LRKVTPRADGGASGKVRARYGQRYGPPRAGREDPATITGNCRCRGPSLVTGVMRHRQPPGPEWLRSPRLMGDTAREWRVGLLISPDWFVRDGRPGVHGGGYLVTAKWPVRVGGNKGRKADVRIHAAGFAEAGVASWNASQRHSFAARCRWFRRSGANSAGGIRRPGRNTMLPPYVQ
jgi:hypothetical protein